MCASPPRLPINAGETVVAAGEADNLQKLETILNPTGLNPTGRMPRESREDIQRRRDTPQKNSVEAFAFGGKNSRRGTKDGNLANHDKNQIL
jgi:hypothetical protein